MTADFPDLLLWRPPLEPACSSGLLWTGTTGSRGCCLPNLWWKQARLLTPSTCGIGRSSLLARLLLFSTEDRKFWGRSQAALRALWSVGSRGLPLSNRCDAGDPDAQ